MGAKFATSAKDLAMQSDYLFVSVGQKENLEALFEHPEDGIMDAVKKDSIIIDHSPRRTEYAHNLKEKLDADRRVTVLDAPIHDENMSAKHIKMQLTVGGDQAEFLHVLPLLKFYSQHLAFIGDTEYEENKFYAEYDLQDHDI